jgi:hypothetical protein
MGCRFGVGMNGRRFPSGGVEKPPALVVFGQYGKCAQTMEYEMEQEFAERAEIPRPAHREFRMRRWQSVGLSKSLWFEAPVSLADLRTIV